MNDEEKILLQRESDRHERQIENAQNRAIALQTKIRGYNKLEKCNEKLLKVFIGYLVETGLFTDEEVISAFAERISKQDNKSCTNKNAKTNTLTSQIRLILSKRMLLNCEIIKILKGS